MKIINYFVWLLFLVFVSCELEEKLSNTIAITVVDFETTINENPFKGQALGQLQAGASSGTIGFSMLLQTPDSAMTVHPATGFLFVSDSSQFDFELNPILNAQILVTSLIDSTIFDTAFVTITLTDLEDGQSITLVISDFQASINENPFHTQAIGQLQTAVSSGTVTYSILSQSPDSAISVHPSTAFIFVDKENLFDYETNPTISASVLGISSVDPAIKDTAQILINLIDVDENSAVTLTVSDFTGSINENPFSGLYIGQIPSTISTGNINFSILSESHCWCINSSHQLGDIICK